MNVKVTKQSKTGRNERFNVNGKDLTRVQFCKEIKAGKHKDFYVRDINGIQTPVSKPDAKKKNNLG